MSQKVYIKNPVAGTVEERVVLPPERVSEVHVNEGFVIYFSRFTNSVYFSARNDTKDTPPTKLDLRINNSPHVPTVKQISVWKHELILTEEGTLYSGTLAGNNTLCHVPHSDKFSMVCAGYGRSYACNMVRQDVCMLDGTTSVQYHDKLSSHLSVDEVVVGMTGGYDHVIAVTSLGNAFGIGYSHHGEVGAATTGQFETWTPCALNSTRTRIKEASSGLFHTVYLPSNETDCVYVTGRNNEAQCLQPTTFKVEITKVMIENVCKAVATTYTTFIILNNGQLLEAGGSYGKRPAGSLGPYFQQQEAEFQSEVDSGKLRVVMVSPYSFNNIGVLLQETSTMEDYLYKKMKQAARNSVFNDVTILNYN